MRDHRDKTVDLPSVEKREGELTSLETIRELLVLLATNGVTEFECERGAERLKLKRGDERLVPSYQASGESTLAMTSNVVLPTAPQSVSAAIVPLQQSTSAAAGPSISAAAPEKNLKEVLSPMVGTFYRRPAIDSPPYVEPGDIVKKGDVLCIVEAMKLMNEIETEVGGRIAEICIEDGQMIEYGEVLFRIEPIK